MNFLAHLFLSGDSQEVIIGNFIADGIKGSHRLKYSEGIRAGIILHHKIDQFTDHHPVVTMSKERLRPKYSKYSSVIVDIFYDHFLAFNWLRYSQIPLNEYASDVYQLMNKNIALMPPLVVKFLPYMVAGNWLFNYSNFEGIENVLKGMSRRAKFVSHMEEAIYDLKKDYQLYEKEFSVFFSELIEYVEGEKAGNRWCKP
jgi:acyl carrier protein phosphodiesterase